MWEGGGVGGTSPTARLPISNEEIYAIWRGNFSSFSGYRRNILEGQGLLRSHIGNVGAHPDNKKVLLSPGQGRIGYDGVQTVQETVGEQDVTVGKAHKGRVEP